ncbi:hypothetical protein Sps_03416 [Shewanella psychrophila]|uniref:Uncharacterized protein n=1 Tax=Shewanella psychrophila TaxID=225848 RepID=A0A1S6HSQ0_9GAMM|nr:hypothetical protein Sps_03416 [Shewanella psychrophila]
MSSIHLQTTPSINALIMIVNILMFLNEISIDLFYLFYPLEIKLIIKYIPLSS